MRKFLINVNGNSYEVEVEEVGADSVAKPATKTPVQASVAKATPAPATKTPPAAKTEPKKEVVVSAGQEVIEAPMPGNIWKVLVKEGDTVSEGDTLLILEAMKMENEIMAPSDGTVDTVPVVKGASVNSGDVLVTLK